MLPILIWIKKDKKISLTKVMNKQAQSGRRKWSSVFFSHSLYKNKMCQIMCKYPKRFLNSQHTNSFSPNLNIWQCNKHLVKSWMITAHWEHVCFIYIYDPIFRITHFLFFDTVNSIVYIKSLHVCMVVFASFRREYLYTHTWTQTYTL